MQNDKNIPENEDQKQNLKNDTNKNQEHEKTDNPEQSEQQPNQRKNSGSASRIDSIISSPTESVRSRHSAATWANTGTNVSYEGQTAPGAGGSVGTGQSSGQDATGATINTDSAYEAGRVGHTDYHDGNKETKESQSNTDEFREDDKSYSKKGDNAENK